ncbi:hypothetical protein D3C80_1834110 [compost metagenome]
MHLCGSLSSLFDAIDSRCDSTGGKRRVDWISVFRISCCSESYSLLWSTTTTTATTISVHDYTHDKMFISTFSYFHSFFFCLSRRDGRTTMTGNRRNLQVSLTFIGSTCALVHGDLCSDCLVSISYIHSSYRSP